MTMSKRRKISVLAGVLIGLAFFGTANDLFSCHGILSLRFLPYAQARAKFAQAQAELIKQRASRPPLESIPAAGSWLKYYDNPVFKPGANGSWEEFSVDCFTIGYYQDKYWMWYVGTPDDLHCQIGLATSLDGVNWTRNPQNPVLRLGPAGSWDNSLLICQHILFDESRGQFEMWYVGGNTDGLLGIGYASSPDGVTWTKYAGNPVMTVTEPWEGTLIEGQTLLKKDGVYKMWYGGLALGTDVSHIGYAESTDGIHWIKYAGNPIISPAGGDPLPWDGYSVDTPDVYFEDGLYHMYYRGWRKKSGTSWIGHATSTDGINWVRDPANPVLVTASTGGVWDNFQIYRARVFPGKGAPDPNRFVVDRMWFTGRDYTLKSQVGLAFRIRRASDSDAIAAAFPQGVNQDQMELSALPSPQGTVDLAYFTPWIGNVTLTIFDQNGRKVRTLVREPKLPGYFQSSWDGRNEIGRGLPGGLYFAELRGDTFVLSKQIVLD
jgi:predicted GH43/DUF377 family glycosyl hydrolase